MPIAIKTVACIKSITRSHSHTVTHCVTLAADKQNAQRRRKHCALAVVRRTHKHTNTHTQTDRGDYNTLRSLARSVNI